MFFSFSHYCLEMASLIEKTQKRPHSESSPEVDVHTKSDDKVKAEKIKEPSIPRNRRMTVLEASKSTTILFHAPQQ